MSQLLLLQNDATDTDNGQTNRKDNQEKVYFRQKRERLSGIGCRYKRSQKKHLAKRK